MEPKIGEPVVDEYVLGRRERVLSLRPLKGLHNSDLRLIIEVTFRRWRPKKTLATETGEAAMLVNKVKNPSASPTSFKT